MSVEDAVAAAHRNDWSFVLASTIRFAGDLDSAEECVQDAYAKALATWPTSGIPTLPAAWLTTVARRRAIDMNRRKTVHQRLMGRLRGLPEADPSQDERSQPSQSEPVDDRLRLIFTCCHPALSPEAQVALTLRLLCGLTTAEVARAFLVSEATMAARITRAKKKIALAGIPYRVPPKSELPARIESVLDVVHLLYTTGHTAPTGTDLVRRDLTERSIELAQMLHALMPGQGDVTGLLALLLLTDARSETRTDAEGRLVLLADQDRSKWEHSRISIAVALMTESLSLAPPGRFTLMAAIAAVHAEAPSWEETGWDQIVSLYDLLLTKWASPVVELNRAVAVGMAYGPEAGLGALEDIQEIRQLEAYSYLHSTRADFLRKLGRTSESRASYEEAIALSDNDVERAFLSSRLSDLG